MFSVVTVVRNGESEIERTLRSCIGQDFQDKEYIVIDGASTDHTNKVVNRYQKDISCYVCELDKGLYEAMNKAIGIASGQYILFMNCGDTFCDSSVLSRIAEKISILDFFPDVIYGNTLYKFGEVLLKTPPMPLARMERKMVFCHQSCLVRTERIKAMPFDLKYRYAADYDMMLKLYHQNRVFQYLDLSISTFSQERGETLQHFRQSTMERYAAQKDGGTLHNILLMRWSIFRIELGLFVKALLPQKLKDAVFYHKYKNRYV